MKILISVGISIALLIGVFLALPQGTKKENTIVNAQTNSYSEIQNNISSGSLLVDVRTAEEFTAGHIKDSINIPLSDIQTGLKPNSDYSKTLYVYCRSGNRSAEAKKLLEKAGFSKVIDLGAMSDVVALGAQEMK
ncbi:MAG: rhodanese-like domain-containing protein [Candidatus Saccharibacteria bacterium]|nr:rhodanese-like domain-containing protein [Candidatus Saccharibacteria bacterium]